MQVLVVYYSRSGNTKKLAEAVSDGVLTVPGMDCITRKASDVTPDDFVNCQGIIAGSPVYFGSMAAELKDVFDRCIGVRRQMGNKIGAAFSTAGDPTGGKETTIFSIIQAMLIYGMIIVGDPLEATGHYGVACTGSPDADTMQNAMKLGKRVAWLVKKIWE